MILKFFLRLIWLLALLALQVFVLNHVHFMGIATAIATPWFVMMMPQGSGRVWPQLWAFALGLASDVFAGTPGLGAAAMTLVGLMQQPVLKAFTPKEAVEGFIPSYATLGRWGYMRYAFVLLAAHHLLYFTLEVLSMAFILDGLMRASASLAISYIVVLSLERLRHHK